jgi:glycosyltransferase involved in cell wall biosynthesis
VKLRLFGVRNSEGGGTHFGGFVDALRRLPFLAGILEEVDDDSQSAVRRAIREATATDVNIWFVPHGAMSSCGGKHVLWGIFETDRPTILPWLRDKGDVVWTPSAWARDVLIANGVDRTKIDVIPEGVEGELFHPHARQAIAGKKQPFRFLAVGKFEGRKSYPELLAAFREAFGESRDVELGIKADWFANPGKTDELRRLVEASGLSNVRLYSGNWQRTQLAALYRCSDVFVLPTKAEGWGLPLLEAAACGLPIVTTFYSGHTEFLQHIRSSVVPVDYTLEPVADAEFRSMWRAGDRDIGRWAQPSLESLAEAMQTVRCDHAIYRKHAYFNSLIVTERFAWHVAAHRALSSLEGRGLLQLVDPFATGL